MSESLDLVSISREALESDTESNGLSPIDGALEAKYREQSRLLYDTPMASMDHMDEHVALKDSYMRPDNTTEDDRTGEYEFRLFSGPKVRSCPDPGNASQRIAIRSPTPVSGDPSFVNRQRRDSYYFTGPLSGLRAEKITRAAISGEEILQGAKLRWPGCELPWRVTIIKSGRPCSASKLQDAIQSTTNSNKKRIGKKRRIAIRKKKQAIEEKKVTARRAQAEKEVAEKEKRTRKNREKKVKRKMKEKIVKMSKTEEAQAAEPGT